MQILVAECANDPALEDRPETLNRIGVNRVGNVLAMGVINRVRMRS